jgi:hypothetical protein
VGAPLLESHASAARPRDKAGAVRSRIVRLIINLACLALFAALGVLLAWRG